MSRAQYMKTTLELQFHFWYLNSLIKQSRRSEIYRLQNRRIDDTFQALGKPFVYKDVQSHPQILNLHCIKISLILHKEKLNHKEMDPRALS